MAMPINPTLSNTASSAFSLPSGYGFEPKSRTSSPTLKPIPVSEQSIPVQSIPIDQSTVVNNPIPVGQSIPISQSVPVSQSVPAGYDSPLNNIEPYNLDSSSSSVPKKKPSIVPDNTSNNKKKNKDSNDNNDDDNLEVIEKNDFVLNPVSGDDLKRSYREGTPSGPLDVKKIYDYVSAKLKGWSTEELGGLWNELVIKGAEWTTKCKEIVQEARNRNKKAFVSQKFGFDDNFFYICFNAETDISLNKVNHKQFVACLSFYLVYVLDDNVFANLKLGVPPISAALNADDVIGKETYLLNSGLPFIPQLIAKIFTDVSQKDKTNAKYWEERRDDYIGKCVIAAYFMDKRSEYVANSRKRTVTQVGSTIVSLFRNLNPGTNYMIVIKERASKFSKNFSPTINSNQWENKVCDFVKQLGDTNFGGNRSIPGLPKPKGLLI